MAQSKDPSANPHKMHRDRTRNRFLKEGLDSFEPHNVLELLLFYSIPRKDTNNLAHTLLDEFGTLDHVFDASYEDLCAIKGITKNTAVLFKMIPQLFRQYMDTKLRPDEVYDTTEKRFEFFIPKFIGRTVETLFIAALDGSDHIITYQLLDEGNFNQVPMIASNVVKFALKHQSDRIILSHNHPLGVAAPSRDDLYTTSSLRKALCEIGILLEDHIIIGKNLDACSLKDRKLLEYY